MKYWVLFADSLADGAVLSCIPSGGPRSNKYNKAKSIKDKFPALEDAVMCFDPNYPDNLKLYDILDCLDSVLVLNGKTKALFESVGVTEEFLRVQLWDHQNNVASDDYYIFNCLNKVDFIDMEKSKVAMNTTFPSRVMRVINLIVREDLEKDHNILCPSNMTGQLFISDDFKIKLESGGITGFKLLPADGWDGLDV